MLCVHFLGLVVQQLVSLKWIPNGNLEVVAGGQKGGFNVRPHLGGDPALHLLHVLLSAAHDLCQLLNTEILSIADDDMGQESKCRKCTSWFFNSAGEGFI